MGQWLGFIASLIVVLVGAIVNVALVANMLGKMSRALDGLSRAVDKLERRMDAVDTMDRSSGMDAARVEVRLSQVEQNTHGLQNLRTETAERLAIATAERKQHHASLERQERRLDECFSQIRTITGVLQRNRLLFEPNHGD